MVRDFPVTFQTFVGIACFSYFGSSRDHQNSECTMKIQDGHFKALVIHFWAKMLRIVFLKSRRTDIFTSVYPNIFEEK